MEFGVVGEGAVHSHSCSAVVVVVRRRRWRRRRRGGACVVLVLVLVLVLVDEISQFLGIPASTACTNSGAGGRDEWGVLDERR